MTKSRTKSRKIEGTAWVTRITSGCVGNMAWESRFIHFAINGERFIWITQDESKVPSQGAIGTLSAYARVDKDGDETGKLFAVKFLVTGER